MSFSRRIMRVCGAGAAAAAGLVALAATHGGRREEGEANILRKWQLQAKTKIPQHGVYHGTGSKWDSDWDRRDPASLTRPLKDGATPEQEAEYKKKLEENKAKTSRIIVLVRHGQYNMDGKNDSERYLTEVGREQAEKTGKRIAELYDYIKNSRLDENGNPKPLKLRLIKSTMTRATETANIVLKSLPDIEHDSCDLIREGAPIEPDPPLNGWWPEPHEFFQEGARIEAGFRKYFHRAAPDQEEQTVDVIVCHGNVIRYCVCRALQLPPEAWLRMAVHNGSITVLTVTPSGRVKLSQLGEAGHFPPNLLTFN